MNLNPRGEGDMESDAIAELDLVLGSFHSALRGKERSKKPAPSRGAFCWATKTTFGPPVDPERIGDAIRLCRFGAAPRRWPLSETMLLHSQRPDRLDRGGTPRGHPAREHGHANEHDHHGRKRERVVGLT